MSEWPERLLAGALGGLLSLGGKEALDYWRSPRLRFSKGNDAPWSVTRASNVAGGGSDPHHLSRYLRIGVENYGRRIAKSCRIYLKGFQLPGCERNYLDNPVQLRWSGNAGTARDLPPGLPMFADVLVGTKRQSWPTVPAVDPVDNQLEGLMMQLADPQQPRPTLTIVATADGAAAKTCAVDFVWTGAWESLEWK